MVVLFELFKSLSIPLSNDCLIEEMVRWESEERHLNKLSTFRVAYNDLTGIIPSSGQFSTFDESNFEGNPNLCGPMVGRNCSSETSQMHRITDDEVDKQRVIDSPVIYYSFIAASHAIGFWGVTAVLAFKYNWRFMELEDLGLDSNGIAGWVDPQGFMNLQNLKTLALYDNHITRVDPWISNITSLKVISMSSNMIEEFPSGFWGMQNLEILFLSDNNIKRVGPSILNNTSLQYLELSSNMIKEFPSGFWGMQNLKYLDLGDGFWGMQNLETLYLDDNDIKSVPPSISNITSLQILDLSSNMIKEFPSDLSNNNLSGIIPNCINNITSWIRQPPRSIPNSFQNLMSLECLDLSFNHLSSEIPPQLAQLNGLSTFRVAYNNLSGIIPSNGQFSTFNAGDFEGNPNLCGPMVGRNCSSGTSQTHRFTDDEVDKPRIIDSPVIYYSFIAASYAIGFWGVIAVLVFKENWRVKFFLAADGFWGMQNLKNLYLGDNNIKRVHPSISNITSLQILDLSSNMIKKFPSGSNPESFQNLMSLESLDLSFNPLSSEIPPQLVQLNALSTFRVAYNNLSGIIPSSGQFSTFNESNFEGNPNFCGPMVGRNCSSETSQTHRITDDEGNKPRVIDSPVIYYSFIAASHAIGFWGVIAVLAFKYNWRVKFFLAADDLIYACGIGISSLARCIRKYDLDAINLMISTVMASGMAEEFGEDERMAGITVFALTDAAFVRVDT
ncbi:Protein STRUBBELIG-RECEPTOR FAMILY 7 [Acorus calamus]|uniref:Protein STRUBBELIG-RECEPTOR FAMILY 7 n=1 Tax=Acorus calamus TaxID=4465 RepID=A0AAV9CEH2_ACOCL|nr:Protein STRUBBELIG-RECEPTOR FAMILY 7 [Acorus calamus]